MFSRSTTSGTRPVPALRAVARREGGKRSNAAGARVWRAGCSKTGMWPTLRAPPLSEALQRCGLHPPPAASRAAAASPPAEPPAEGGRELPPRSSPAAPLHASCASGGFARHRGSRTRFGSALGADVLSGRGPRQEQAGG